MSNKIIPTHYKTVNDIDRNASVIKNPYAENIEVRQRNIKTVDSSVFSLYYGGGGHKQASGCTVDTSVFFASVEEKLWRINYG